MSFSISHDTTDRKGTLTCTSPCFVFLLIPENWLGWDVIIFLIHNIRSRCEALFTAYNRLHFLVPLFIPLRCCLKFMRNHFKIKQMKDYISLIPRQPCCCFILNLHCTEENVRLYIFMTCKNTHFSPNHTFVIGITLIMPIQEGNGSRHL